ncbi:MAG: hypothetical protein WEH44_00400, partial [Pirellulaceae bacterium]
MRLPMTRLSRRQILAGSVAAAGLACLKPMGTSADERPAVTQPRATSGDDAVEPDWSERVTISVGPKNADLVGT